MSKMQEFWLCFLKNKQFSSCYHCPDLLSKHIESLVQPLGVLHPVKVGVGISTHSSFLLFPL